MGYSRQESGKTALRIALNEMITKGGYKYDNKKTLTSTGLKTGGTTGRIHSIPESSASFPFADVVMLQLQIPRENGRVDISGQREWEALECPRHQELIGLYHSLGTD